MYSKETKIDANITIRSAYTDSIRIKVQDNASGITFLDLEMTREAFINATMNQLANTPVKEAVVYHLDKVGKKQERKPFSFVLPEGTSFLYQREVAKAMVGRFVPDGWRADDDFGSQTSFSSDGDRIAAHTTIRRWV